MTNKPCPEFGFLITFKDVTELLHRKVMRMGILKLSEKPKRTRDLNLRQE